MRDVWGMSTAHAKAVCSPTSIFPLFRGKYTLLALRYAGIPAAWTPLPGRENRGWRYDGVWVARDVGAVRARKRA